MYYFLFFTLVLSVVGDNTIEPAISQGEDDFIKTTIVNRHDFEFVLNPGDEVCKPHDGADVFLLVYVHSAPENFKRRLSLRESWARRSMFRDIRLVFMMGQVQDKKISDQLSLEASVYMDIVQENFVDSYKNLTYKGIMAMKWISQYCRTAKYILKVDDDILTNIFILMRHLHSLDEHGIIKNSTIMCLVWDGMGVMRDKASKWYLSNEEFKKDKFDRYCSGSAYLLTNDLPARMFARSQYVKFFWVDDFYMTGLLARAVEAKYEMFSSLYIINTGLVDQRFMGKMAPYTVFGHLPGELNKLFKLWSFLLNNQLRSYPYLTTLESKLLHQGDFKYLKDLKWSSSLWESARGLLDPLQSIDK